VFPADVSKFKVVERPTTALVAGTAPAAAVVTLGSTPNPTVEPGKVSWHPSLEAARAAAAESGKPVLLFQMMGRLDHQFC
jgi:hypothetical protein